MKWRYVMYYKSEAIKKCEEKVLIELRNRNPQYYDLFLKSDSDVPGEIIEFLAEHEESEFVLGSVQRLIEKKVYDISWYELMLEFANGSPAQRTEIAFQLEDGVFGLLSAEEARRYISQATDEYTLTELRQEVMANKPERVEKEEPAKQKQEEDVLPKGEAILKNYYRSILEEEEKNLLKAYPSDTSLQDALNSIGQAIKMHNDVTNLVEHFKKHINTQAALITDLEENLKIEKAEVANLRNDLDVMTAEKNKYQKAYEQLKSHVQTVNADIRI